MTPRIRIFPAKPPLFAPRTGAADRPLPPRR